MTSNYKNFDFGREWHRVLPHLKTQEFKDLFQSIKNESIRMEPWHVNEDVPPVYLTTNSAFGSLEIHLLDHEIKHDRLTDPERKLYEEMKKFPRWGEEYSSREDTLMDFVMERLELTWETNRYHLAFYIPIGQCFDWNSSFGLWMAQKVCPEEKWVVEESDNHCTVICHESKKIFDIIYWSIKGRLYDYCEYHAGQTDWKELQYSREDKTLGGKLAYENSRMRQIIIKKDKLNLCTGYVTSTGVE